MKKDNLKTLDFFFEKSWVLMKNQRCKIKFDKQVRECKLLEVLWEDRILWRLGSCKKCILFDIQKQNVWSWVFILSTTIIYFSKEGEIWPLKQENLPSSLQKRYIASLIIKLIFVFFLALRPSPTWSLPEQCCRLCSNGGSLRRNPMWRSWCMRW